MQPLRVVLTGLGGVAALASLMLFVYYRSSEQRREPARRAVRFSPAPHRNRLAAYYRVSLN